MLLIDLVGINHAENSIQQNQHNHQNALVDWIGNEDAPQHNQTAGDNKAQPAKPLGKIPAGVVCHAPFGAQPEHTVSFDLRHDIAQWDE